MLAFVPPISGTPRRPIPEGSPPERPGTAVGVLLAVILLVVGMLLPWFRPALHGEVQPSQRSQAAPAR